MEDGVWRMEGEGERRRWKMEDGWGRALAKMEGGRWRVEKGRFGHHSSARFVAPRERRPAHGRFTRFRKVKGGQLRWIEVD